MQIGLLMKAGGVKVSNGPELIRDKSTIVEREKDVAFGVCLGLVLNLRAVNMVVLF